MKKTFYLIAALAMTFAACQKEDSITSVNSAEPSNSAAKSSYSNGIGAIPTTFTKKVLVEEYVGTSYGNVPDASEMLNNLANQYPGLVYISSLHKKDMLETFHTDRLVNYLNNSTTPSIPSAMIDRETFSGTRFMTASGYQTSIDQMLSLPVNCGLAIKSIAKGGTATITVYSGFNAAMPGDYNLNVYLVEDNVMSPSLNQANNSNNNSGSTFYMAGNPISNYAHQNVLRLTLTQPMGNAIKPASITPGGSDIQTFYTDIPSSFNANNCYVIAYITKVNSGISDEVINVQKAKLGTTKTWN